MTQLNQIDITKAIQNKLKLNEKNFKKRSLFNRNKKTSSVNY
ncbi:MAG: hypothetical protein ACOC16_02995 [Nanoarchaeota archaeon]